MGLFDKLTGTKHPDAGVIPCPAAEVRAALLAINGPDVPYAVRNGTPAERADLVAEWRVLEPAWRTFFSRSRLSRTLKTRMRLDAESHEVRALDEQWEVTWVGDTPRLARSREYSRGQVTTVSRQWEVQRGPDGRLHKTEVFRFDPAEMKVPLQDAVLGAGWTWRGVVFKL
ncbi:hypothetical protein ACFC1L_05140 [Streptomyces sp. NPDC056210]|uniref:hypothetical protein n=2 Tax=Streptomyces TaxID=1883 RepID=UPI001D0A10D0|nr:hypothetical protein [Streptomyces longhuiensis]UDM04094.1 hypothetical protein LGI35_40500 [Streptomyces longhuiensis]